MNTDGVIRRWNAALRAAFKQVCDDHGWTQTRLADEMGVTESSVRRYENRSWSLKGAAALASVAGVDLGALLTAFDTKSERLAQQERRLLVHARHLREVARPDDWKSLREAVIHLLDPDDYSYPLEEEACESKK